VATRGCRCFLGCRLTFLLSVSYGLESPGRTELLLTLDGSVFLSTGICDAALY
jgi:hypothetical protein